MKFKNDWRMKYLSKNDLREKIHIHFAGSFPSAPLLVRTKTCASSINDFRKPTINLSQISRTLVILFNDAFAAGESSLFCYEFSPKT